MDWIKKYIEETYSGFAIHHSSGEVKEIGGLNVGPMVLHINTWRFSPRNGGTAGAGIFILWNCWGTFPGIGVYVAPLVMN